MDDYITGYVLQSFIEEMQVEINHAFSLFDFFEYKTAHLGFIDIITNESEYSPDMMKDLFIRELNDKLDYCLKEHRVQVTKETSIYQKNQILKALALVQNLEDYTGIIRLLESLEQEDEIFSLIISDLSMLDQTEVMTCIERIDSLTLKSLKQYIYSKETEEGNPSHNPITLNIKYFSELFGEQYVGVQLVKSGVLLGQSFQTYLNYIESEIFGIPKDQLGLHLLSIIYLCSEGLNNPIDTYRKNSYRILQCLNLVSKVETQILDAVAKLNEYKKAKHESSRVL